MFFEHNNFKINILSVLSLSWKESNAYAAARPYNALSYRIRGNADFTYQNGKIHIKSDDIIYVPKDFDYTINASDEELIVVHFEIENGVENNIATIRPIDSAYFSKKFQSLYEVWSKKNVGYEYECMSILYKILAKLYKQASEQRLDITSDKMNEIIDYIHDHYTEKDLNVTELTKIAGMSDTYFRKMFISAFNTTPLKYINDLRISYALELLRSGYYSVTEVAEKSGFDNQKYFSTIIKNKTGHSPLSYKNNT